MKCILFIYGLALIVVVWNLKSLPGFYLMAVIREKEGLTEVSTIDELNDVSAAIMDIALILLDIALVIIFPALIFYLNFIK